MLYVRKLSQLLHIICVWTSNVSEVDSVKLQIVEALLMTADWSVHYLL